MKITNVSSFSISAIACAILAGALVRAEPQQHQGMKTGSQQHGMMDMGKHMKDMHAADKKLSALVSKMNAAQGSAKTKATAEVVTELVAQQKAMRSMCMGMMGGMGKHGGTPKPMDHSKHQGG